jgi:mRNA-degrading endonuclease RelE of RelBE toxin-antitoxin system
MNEVEIIFTETLKEDYQELPKHIQRKFDKQVKFLARDPKHSSLRIHRIRDHWEFYVDIHYRCIFQKEGNVYVLKHVGGHKIVDRFV